MADHLVYRAMVAAVQSGALREPFTVKDFQTACPGFGKATYRLFLGEHRKGNGHTTELFERMDVGEYRLVRPLLYGLEVDGEIHKRDDDGDGEMCEGSP